MQAAAKISVMKRLKRIEGQVRGLARMVEDDRYCIDIVTQLSAVRAALRRAEEEILADHVAHCVEQAITSGSKAEQRRKVAELRRAAPRGTLKTKLVCNLISFARSLLIWINALPR